MVKRKKYPEAGTYTAEIYEKGKNEMAGKKLKEGDYFFTVWTDNGGSGWDTQSDFEAQVLSRLIRIENKLKRMK